MKRSALGLIVLLFALVVTGCGSPKADATRQQGTVRAEEGVAAVSAKAEDPRPAVELTIAYGSEKKTWLDEQATAFMTKGPRTKSGRAISITAKAMGSGEALQAIMAGSLKPTVFSPASGLYVSLLNSAWMAKGTHTKPLSPAGEPLVLSPIVVAMWKPMAEALGWPRKSVGWRELLKVAGDPKGWGAHGHPEWGRFKLGHTHPEFSNSGLQAVLAEAYVGAKKTRGLSAKDLEKKETTAKLAEIEQTIVHYGKSTGFFAEKMLARGPGYLSAAVLYENLVIESYGKKNDGSPFPIVAVYPTEGTFWSDHPYAILDAEWVGSDEREAAEAFLKFLRDRPAQERALALGFRPADASIAMTAPIDAEHGVDPKQPQTLLEVPDGPTLEKLLAVWQTVKKSSDVAMVFDISGSMVGDPLLQAKQGAKAFLGTLHDRDEVSLVFFNSTVYPAIGPKKLEANKAFFENRIDGQIANGGTALYDAIAKAYDEAKERAAKSPASIHAVMVMTDGRDAGSKLKLPELNQRFAKGDEAANEVKVFTIAYGNDADVGILGQIAEAARGTSAKGSKENIVEVYRDMAAFF